MEQRRDYWEVGFSFFRGKVRGRDKKKTWWKYLNQNHYIKAYNSTQLNSTQFVYRPIPFPTDIPYKEVPNTMSYPSIHITSQRSTPLKPFIEIYFPLQTTKTHL